MGPFKSVYWPILVPTFFLLSIGILVIFSSSKELALQQGIFALIGTLFFFFLSQFDYRALKNLITPLYLLVILLLVVVALVGFETRGSIRWIPLPGFSFQPSEFAKPVLILLLANFWNNHLPSWRNILLSLVWIALPLVLIFRQPDLGTTLTLIFIWACMLFSSNISPRKILILGFVALLVVPLSWFLLKPYQRQRISSFLSPSADPLGVGYNIIQSTIAVGSGELMGRGLGSGTQSRLQFLPEFRTDFIFASIAEEMGLVGASLILLSYFVLLLIGLKIAQNSRDQFGFLISIGTVAMLIFQTMVNVGMNIGIFPITGITLPLISYGGSSLIATMICLGLLSSVSRWRRKVDIKEIGG